MQQTRTYFVADLVINEEHLHAFINDVGDDFFYKKLMHRIIDDIPVERLKHVFRCNKEEREVAGMKENRYEVKLYV